MFWFFFGVVAKLARRWSCKPEIVGSSPTDSTSVRDEVGGLRDEYEVSISSSLILHPSSLEFAGVAQMAQERSPGTTEAVSSILTTGSVFSANTSGCRVEATHLPWEQVHAGSIPAIQTKD